MNTEIKTAKEVLIEKCKSAHSNDSGDCYDTDEIIAAMEAYHNQFNSNEGNVWVNVGDDMPKNDFGKYLVTDGENVSESTWVSRTTKDAPQFLFTQIKNITHWMLLPAPPNKDENPITPIKSNDVGDDGDMNVWFAMAYGALQSLCELKEIKDTEGKTDYYLEQQPKAWYAANKVIELWKKSDYGANKKSIDVGDVEKAAEYLAKISFPNESSDMIYVKKTKTGNWKIGYTNDYPMQHGNGEQYVLPKTLVEWQSKQQPIDIEKEVLVNLYLKGEPKADVEEDEKVADGWDEYDNAMNQIGQLQEQLKEAEEEIRDLNRELNSSRF